LLAALRVDLAALPETAQLIGLESNNEVHTETVGDHTLRVVEECRKLFSSNRLTQPEQQLVELAAYLHDIGKGPKSRWDRCGGKQQVDPDHPIKSTKMLERILTEEVQAVTDDEARILCKLVCYHDLYGDIIGRDRRREQLADIAQNERDLEMLITIGRGDMSSVREVWGFLGDSQAATIRDWVLQQLRGG
jgi:UTP:GlnB (protein PII) uridylyltransferase